MKRIMVVIISILIVFGAGIGYLASNYYSVLADIRENFADVDISDQYVYGETLFQTRGCVFCHTLASAGADAEVGPHLDGIGSWADDNYIRTSIINPNAVIADNCPEEACEPDVMPQFGLVLDDAQVEALVIYLSAQK